MPGNAKCRRAALAAALGLAFLSAAPAHSQSSAGERVFQFALSQGKLASGERTVRVARGDSVELKWTSDRPLVLHLHGYDVEITLKPDAPQSMRFRAHATGRFPVEIHGSSGRHATLIYVEVHPR